MSIRAFPVHEQETSVQSVNTFYSMLLSMEFGISFSIAKYENDIFSLCETFNDFIYAINFY